MSSSRIAFRLILLVCCAHAMAHVFELSLPSVEMSVADDYGVTRRVTGLLNTTWRIPWGLGALGAGWLVDRFGSKRMLAVYLYGCAAACGLLIIPLSLPPLFVVMFAMGSFACIYHPAGLALISHETMPENRARALGLHGIFGSAGIGLAPFIAGAFLAAGMTWRQYYLAVSIPGFALGTLFLSSSRRGRSGRESPASRVPADTHPANWPAFMGLTVVAVFQGFTYSAYLSFLARYLGADGPSAGPLAWLAADSRGAFYAGGVLLIGCVGQYQAGRFARPDRLERQLTTVILSTVPLLVWMAFARGVDRLAAAGLFALVHFMHQPLYNSLVAKYTPHQRRSLCYGFSFAMGFGVGGTGAAFAGFSQHQALTYGVLAGTAAAAAVVAALLWSRARPANSS